MLRVLLRATPVGNGYWQPDCASRHQRLCEMRFVMGAHLACACAELSTCQSGWTLPLFWSPTLGSVHEAGTVDASAVLDARFSFGARGRDRWCIAGTVDAHPCALRLGPSMALTRPCNAPSVPASPSICSRGRQLNLWLTNSCTDIHRTRARLRKGPRLCCLWGDSTASVVLQAKPGSGERLLLG